jgi:hypothetical protein
MLSVVVGSFEVPVFTGKIELVYVVLHDDDKRPVLLHSKQVTVVVGNKYTVGGII